MNMPVYIRPLEEKDCEVSYVWRNDPEIWKFTRNRPSHVITIENEREWIRKVLQDKNACRFAICISATNQYIGNVQLTDIDEEKGSAEFHLFIGEREYWGKNVATQATRLVLDYARKHIRFIRTVYLSVAPENTAAICVYKKSGFVFLNNSQSEMTCRLTGEDEWTSNINICSR